MLIGASMSEEVLPTYKTRLVGNHIMRIFPTRTATIGGVSIKVPPDWTDSRLVYCKDNNVIPFVSSKGNGTDAFVAWIRDYLVNMPSWVKVLYFCDWHEPEANFGAGSAAGIQKYKDQQTKLWNMVQGLPAATRAKVKFGHVMTKQWTEDSNKGNFNYKLYDTGLGDFWGVDSYVLSNIGGDVVKASTLPTPTAFLQYIKGYKFDAGDTRPRLFPELGLIGFPSDTTGSIRAGWLQGVHDEVKTWKVGASGWTQPWSFAGWIWWNTSGAATGEVPTIGQARDFPLHLRSVPDPAKTYTSSDGKTHWISHPETLPNQSGKTQPAPVVTYNAIWTAEQAGITPDPDPDPTPDPGPVDPYPGTGAGTWWLGATMKKADIPTYEPKLKGNQMFRIFPNSDGLPPSWTDPRFAYAQRAKAVPFVSSNIDGDSSKFAAMRTWIINMPSWVTVLYLSDRHEPENNVKDGLTRDKYLDNFKAWWDNVIATLPADKRARVKAGPILTKQWVEDAGKGNFDYGLYDPMKQRGLKTDFFASDHYMNSWKPGSSENATHVAEAYPDPATFFATFKAYKAPTVSGIVDDRERVFAEWGAIGIPLDPDGTKRAKWITDCATLWDTWTVASTGWKFVGACWWNNQGTTSPTSLTPIGTLRFFYLDKYQKDTSGAVALPGNPTAPVKAYNDILTAHLTSAPTPTPDPEQPPPDPGGGTGGGTTPPPGGGGGTTPIPDAPPDTSGLPIDAPAAVKLLSATYTILVTDKDLNILGDPIHEWSYLQLTLRWKEVGSGQFKVPALPYIREQLVPGCRIVVLRQVLGVQSVILAGPMEQKLREWSDNGENAGVGQYTVTFSDDLSTLAARLAYPNPAEPIEAQTSDYWTYSGNPELGMLQLVRDQAGESALAARKVPKLRTAAFSGISGTGTVALGPTTDVNPRERLETLTDVLRKMSTLGVGASFDPDSLGFRTRQTQVGGLDVILFEVVRSRDLRGQVHFSRGMGNLKYYSLEEDAPTLTHVHVGGQFNQDDASAGSDKYVKQFVDTEVGSLAWGRFEGYLARPGSDVSAGKANDDAVREFEDKRATARLAVSAADTVDCRAMVHYGVGDLVSVELDIGDFQVAPVQTVSIQAYPTSGEVVAVTIGDQSARTDTKWIKQLRLMERRVGVLEKRTSYQAHTN